MDAQVTMKQIGTGNLMACGARDFFIADDGSLTFRVGSSRVNRRITVTLHPSDTYEVSYTEMRLKDYVITAHGCVPGVYAEQLGAVVRKMGDR
jgi:hypothetical protein